MELQQQHTGGEQREGRKPEDHTKIIENTESAMTYQTYQESVHVELLRRTLSRQTELIAFIPIYTTTTWLMKRRALSEPAIWRDIGN